ncbi:pyridoxal-phosphate dependent enzyme [Burkholderia pyrrocinia]|uniref:pyridoxal-phosphate dependent enzyme n=1 Tax=Burkholderia pyrrocinia TaxID=60550 RepID=UPI001BCAF69B|nr:pyridoxal-phosphate dependent enzyme [Burkholderia pyrrocinia]
MVDAIGATPFVRLDRLTKAHGLEGTILAKLGYLNRGFSKKDRAAQGIIDKAERSGALRPGQTVVELTLGNIGTGLAIIGGVKSNPFVAVVSKGNPAY